MNWWSTTFFDKYPIVVQADLSKSFQLIKQMKSPFLSSNEEIIQQLNTWNEKLIVIVSDQKERISVCQVRSPFSFNLFPPVQRLIFIEENSSKTIAVALDGTTQMIDYQQPIRHVCSYRRTTLVIRTERNLIFYQLWRVSFSFSFSFHFFGQHLKNKFRSTNGWIERRGHTNEPTFVSFSDSKRCQELEKNHRWSVFIRCSSMRISKHIQTMNDQYVISDFFSFLRYHDDSL